MEELDWVVIGACVMWGICMIGVGILVYRSVSKGDDGKFDQNNNGVQYSPAVRLLWEQEVAGSNPATPIFFEKSEINLDTAMSKMV